MASYEVSTCSDSYEPEASGWSGYFDDPATDELLLSPELRPYASIPEAELMAGDIYVLLPRNELQRLLIAKGSIFTEENTDRNRQLSQRLRTGGEGSEAAKWELVMRNVKLVPHVLRTEMGLSTQGIKEAVSSGLEGLIHAADKHDPDKESGKLPFNAYARLWIKQKVTRDLDDEGHVVRIPVHQQEKLRKAARKEYKLFMGESSVPTLAEVAEVAELDPRELADLRHMTILEPLDPEADIVDRTESTIEEQVIAAEDLDQLTGAMDSLSNMEKDIIERRFGLHGLKRETQLEVAGSYNLSHMAIRTIEQRTLGKLRIIMQVDNTGEDFV